MAKEKYDFLAVPGTVPVSRDALPVHCVVRPSVYSRVKRVHAANTEPTVLTVTVNCELL